MKHIGILCIIIAGLIAGRSAFAEDDKAIATEIKKLTLENFNAMQSEDLEAELKTVHPLSPGYLPTKTQSNALFENFDLRYELVSFTYIGRDGDYAVARIIEKTMRVSGPAFKDNLTDSIAAFKQDNGKWLFWNQMLLTVKYINE